MKNTIKELIMHRAATFCDFSLFFDSLTAEELEELIEAVGEENTKDFLEECFREAHQ